ncbi:MAG: formate dehydrogenase accessory sulfurtransferase FdhD [Pseudomonadota bacterium]
MTRSEQDVTRAISRRAWQSGELHEAVDTVVAEVPVALVYNGVSHVVMMATPSDLEDFALGFSLSEGILERPEQLLGLDIVPGEHGIEVQLEIASAPFAALKAKRRNLTGRTGCGLCGAESLEQAVPEPRKVTTVLTVDAAAIQAALGAMQAAQPLRSATGAVHGVAFCNADGDIWLLREDVGRHNALDKVLGAMHRSGIPPTGFLLVSSRASYEMVAKAASANIPILAAVSAATSLAIEQAEASRLTLLGMVRDGRQLVYTHPERLGKLD